MRTVSSFIVAVTLILASTCAADFTRLTPLPAPKVVASAEPFSEHYLAENMLKPPTITGHRAEYASRNLGVRTFIDFDFGRPVRLAAFQHIQAAQVEAGVIMIYQIQPFVGCAPIGPGAIGTLLGQGIAGPG